MVSIVKSLATKLGTLLGDEANSLYKVSDKITKLQAELEWMEGFLEHAYTQQHQDRTIFKLVSQVQDFAYDGEDIIERYLHEISHPRQDGIWNTLKWVPLTLFTWEFWTLHNLGSEIDKLTANTSDFKSWRETYHNPSISLGDNSLSREVRRTYSHIKEDVIGLEKDIEQVMDQLLKTEVKVVAISGMGGLGKTTLARKVYDHNDIKDHFNNNCVWIYISREFDKMNTNVFEVIFHELEKKDREALPGEMNNNGARERKLIEELPGEISKLLQRKRCLVVIDDIWTEEAWRRLKSAFDSIFTSALSSSKILVTTREQRLLQHIDRSGYHHLLQPLSDDNSWELFKRKAWIEDGDQVQREVRSEMERLGKEMLQHCKGLPIAITTLGGILSTKNAIYEWESVRRNLSSSLLSGDSGVTQEGTSFQLSKILELSYNDLPFHIKLCFLYLGNFPEDYEISAHRLFHLWEAEGFLPVESGARNIGRTSYDIGEQYLNELVQRSMVQVRKCWTGEKIKSFQVHDIMRDMCLRKCEEVSFLSQVEPTDTGMACVFPPVSNKIKKLRRCVLYGKDVRKSFQFEKKAKGLRSLLVFKKWCHLSKVWESVPLLRVLDLQGVQSSGHCYGFEHLIYLRYVCLRKSSFDRPLACLYELEYLETLDLRRTMLDFDFIWGYDSDMSIRNELYKMKRLRHLYLPRYFKVEGDQKLIFPGGSQMETIKNFHPDRCEIEELMKMTNLRVFSITNVYVFWKVEVLKQVLEAPVMKTQGQLINNIHIRIPDLLLWKDPAILNSHPIPNFKELRLTKNLPDNDEGRDHLRMEWEADPNKEIHLILPNCLTRVELSDCYKIGIQDIILGLEKLCHLQVLESHSSLIGATKRSTKVSFSAGSFPHLRKLHILYPQGVDSYGLEIGEAAIPKLQDLLLHSCKNLNGLKNVPNSLTRVMFWNCKIEAREISTLGKLPQLKNLDIQGYEGGKLCFHPASFPMLTQFTLHNEREGVFKEWKIGQGALPSLLRLKVMYYGAGGSMFPDGLTEVILSHCDLGIGDVSLFPNFSRLEKLPHLQVLYVESHYKVYWGGGCNKIMRFSPDSFTQLKQLTLIDLEDLEELQIEKDALPHLQLLHLGQNDALKKLNRLPDSLTQLHIVGSDHLLEEHNNDLLFNWMKELPNLQQLHMDNAIARRSKLSFPPGSFRKLTHLYLSGWRGSEMEVGEGSLSNLQCLYLVYNECLKELPKGLPESVHIQCSPCIKGIEKYNTCPIFKRHGHQNLNLERRRDAEPIRGIHWQIPECSLLTKCFCRRGIPDLDPPEASMAPSTSDHRAPTAPPASS